MLYRASNHQDGDRSPFRNRVGAGLAPALAILWLAPTLVAPKVRALVDLTQDLEDFL